MSIGWFAFIVLPILGGLIAWAGDVIGYRLGKGRRSLFGLRPRTTARLIGVSVGVLLPLIGLGTALIAIPQARIAMFHLTELQQQQAELEQSNAELEKQIRQVEQQIRDASKRADLAVQKANRSEQTAKEYLDYLNNTRAHLRQAQGQVTQVRGRLEAARNALRRADARVLEQRGLLIGLGADVREAQADLAGVESELAAVEADLMATRAKLLASQQEFDLLRTQVRTVLTSPVVLEAGHTLVQATPSVGDTLEETEADLAKVVLLASEAARAYGAEGVPLAVKLMRPLPPDLEFNPGQLPTDAQVLRAFAAQLQEGGKRQIVVEVRVARPMYQAERAPVGVELKAWPYIRIFVENKLIYSVTIDGSEPRVRVFDQLYNLTKIVRREAQQAGMLPDPKTGEYGGMSSEQLLEALDQILAAKGPVLVEVRAAADTFINDPLAIKIDVGKGPAGEPVGAGG